MKMSYFNIEDSEEFEDELSIEFHSEHENFGIWFDKKDAGWFHVYDSMFEGDKAETTEDLCGYIDKELLELMYKKIGRILGK